MVKVNHSSKSIPVPLRQFTKVPYSNVNYFVSVLKLLGFACTKEDKAIKVAGLSNIDAPESMTEKEIRNITADFAK